MKEVRLDHLRAGCLTSPLPPMPGRVVCRRVWYLEDLARDIDVAGISVYWQVLPGRRLAYCDLWTRTIYLSPKLFTRSPYRIRESLTHEMTHILEGRHCEAEIELRQWRRYGPVLDLSWMAA